MLKGKVVVGILPTYYFSDTDPYGDNSHFVRMYEDRIKECGAIAVGLLHSNLDVYKDICDAYLWPGGSIIIKDFYVVFDDILKNKKPLLGVCLGSQAIATYFNILDDQKKQPYLSLLDVYDSNKLDNLYLNKLDGERLNIHKNVVSKEEQSLNSAKHKIKIKKNSFMYDIYGEEEISVVSLHSYEIARTPDNIMVSAKSSDNVIEAVEYHEDGNHILGLQYHPEVMKDYKPFIWLIDNAYNRYNILINKENKIPLNLDFKLIYHESLCPFNVNENGMEEATYYAFLELKNKMKELGYVIDLESGYRSHKVQEKLFDDSVKDKGLEHTEKYVARPYYSEHESGLAIDICGCIDGCWYHEFDKELDDLYKKLHEILADYGFILRYPKNKEDITLYGYEPWHLRFLGNKKVCKYIMDNNLCYEEYLSRR